MLGGEDRLKATYDAQDLDLVDQKLLYQRQVGNKEITQDEYEKYADRLDKQASINKEKYKRELNNYRFQNSFNNEMWDRQQAEQMRQFDLRDRRRSMQYLSGIGSRAIREDFENQEYYRNFIFNKENELKSLNLEVDKNKDSKGNVIDAEKASQLEKE